ncbi:MAG: hypothetical protein HFH47_01590 [Bacilli bacterium]|nr:hypothetical protein [Bacilli bacterium]
MDIKEYRKVSHAFRRVASDMLTTDANDGNIKLIRFRRFIQETKLINNLIQEEIKDIDYDYKGNFIVEEGPWYSVSIPLDRGEHIKAMYDYLIDITNQGVDIRGVAHRFSRGGGKKWNDIVREYMNKVFKPLVNFIVDGLTMEMIEMEKTKQETHIHQNINQNYGTASIAQGNIESVNHVKLNDAMEIKGIIDSFKELIMKEEIDEELREGVMYDLEDIEQEIERDTPKLGRVKRAWKRIQDFMTKLPETVTTYTLMTQQCMELYEKIRPFIGN